MKPHAFPKRFFVLAALLMAGLTESCSWNEDEYKTFALDGNVYTCHGICDIGDDKITENECLAIEARWVKKEDNAYCSIEAKKQCAALTNKEILPNTTHDPNKIHWYEFSGSDLGNGRYIIQYSNQSSDNSTGEVTKYYICGSYDYVRDTTNRKLDPKETTCSPEEIAEFKRLVSMNLCHNDTPYCIPQTSGTPTVSGPDNLPTLENPKTIAICSECPPGQASCSIDGTSYSTTCADLRSDVKHCGACGTQCGPNEVCKDGVCTKRVCDEANWCEEYKVCIDPTASETCGVQDCEEYGRLLHERGSASLIACPLFGECIPDEEGSYHCSCSDNPADKDLYATYYDKNKKIYTCYLRSSNDHCGATQESPGEKCSDNKRCLATQSSGQTNTEYSCHDCENGGFYCPLLNADACIDPKTDAQYCGLDKDCKSFTTCNTEIGQECRDGICQCKQGEIICNVDGVYKCIDPQDSNTHCGASGSCTNNTRGNPNFKGDNCADAGLTCQAGLCQCPQPSDAFCDGHCVNPNTNTMYCGVEKETCQPQNTNMFNGNCANYNGIVSQSLAKCMAGKCSCATSGFDLVQVFRNDANNEYTYQCVDPKTDYAYCEACVINKNGPNCNGRGGCKEGTKCDNGECVESTLRCTKDEVACHSIDRCYDKSIYHINASCTACEQGYCSVTNNPLDGCFLSAEQLHLTDDCQACAPGFCDTNNTLTDGCPLDQAMLHLNATCDGCAEGWADSDLELMNGCDIDLNSDPLHCGQINHNCYDDFYGKSAIGPANGEIACVDGECVVPVCDPDYLNCDTTPECETDRRYDNKNCGRCKNTCQTNVKTCVNGECKSCIQNDWEYDNALLLPCCDGMRYYCQTVSGEYHFYACGYAAAGYDCSLIPNNPNLH